MGNNTRFILILHWLVFFWICFGLGYPTLHRFDARNASPDAQEYYKLVKGSPSDAADLLRYRLLVPWVAKPFFRFSQGHIRSWNPVAFSLLISNSGFTATAACFLLSIGTRFAGSPATA